MDTKQDKIEDIRAALSPHGIFLRGAVHFDGDGPEMASGRRAGTVLLLGNIGGSIWPAFSQWRAGPGQGAADPLDTWSVALIRPLANRLRGQAWFPSEKPWQPFQQWVMRAEGLQASPLGVLIHPEYGLWHGYRGAIGFAEWIGERSAPFDQHPCDHCPDKPCLTTCPAAAVHATTFDVQACRLHIHSPRGEIGCMAAGCIARNACPVGAEYRYPPGQLRFHMAALSRAD
jgi:hypothetical protein